ncbi:KpsF/GutQ family sugar-phosphate isomerase [bacterium]|nr:KpsF/GutQ family sugar-phosphate isomerase [bacterium]MBU1674754.1 KpsF/GutQ family sugar-phosphate isomerase [bacterium]
MHDADVPRPDAEILDIGREVFAQQARELSALGDRLGPSFLAAVRTMQNCDGRVIVTGLGKSGIVARKLAATLTATGTPAHFIHPVEAIHGDLGVAGSGDVMLAISRSGENPEVTQLAGLARHFGMVMIALTGRMDSQLARLSDIVIPCGVSREACPLNLTPTTSATAAMVTGDAIALALLTLRGFDERDFAVYHPGGVLGRSLLLRVGELMHTGEEMPLVGLEASLRECLPELVGKRLGCACVVRGDGTLAGICADGDVKRILLEYDDPLEKPVSELMTPDPETIGADDLAVVALRRMEERKQGPITVLVVVDTDGKPVGLLHIHDILRAGIYGRGSVDESSR